MQVMSDYVTSGGQTTPALLSERLEQDIDHCLGVVIRNQDPSVKRAAWFAMAAAHRERSPESVASMERERGLR